MKEVKAWAVIDMEKNTLSQSPVTGQLYIYSERYEAEYVARVCRDLTGNIHIVKQVRVVIEEKAKHTPHNDMLKGVKVYACVLDGQIIGCNSMSHAMDCYNANVDDHKEAYIIEAVAKRKIWKPDIEETQWESEVIEE